MKTYMTSKALHYNTKTAPLYIGTKTHYTLHKKATIHQVTTMLATSKKKTISRSQPPAIHRC